MGMGKIAYMRFIIGLYVMLGLMINPLPVQAAETFKIAAIFSKTTELSATQTIETGFLATRLAVEELNRQGGILGKRIELLEYDNKGTALGSKIAAQQAVKDGVVAVIGATWSSHSLAMAPVLQAAKIPMITPYSTIPDVTLVGDYIFRSCFIDPFQGTVMAAFARGDLKARTAVILINTGERFCIDIAKIFAQDFPKRGGRILWEGPYLGESTDFTPLLDKAKKLKPDVIFNPGTIRDSGFLIKQARQMGIATTFLGADAWDEQMYEYGGKAIDGSYHSDHWNMLAGGVRSQQFVKAYQKRFGGTINSKIPMGYDAVMLLADAIKRAGSFAPAKIRDALAKTRGYQGVTGEITFDANRNPINKTAVILKFEKGASVFVKEIKPQE